MSYDGKCHPDIDKKNISHSCVQSVAGRSDRRRGNPIKVNFRLFDFVGPEQAHDPPAC
jgi:hypothetical protein